MVKSRSESNAEAESITPSGLRRWGPFAIAAALSFLVVGLRVAAGDFLGQNAPFFMASVAAGGAAYIGGLWPGLFATLLTTGLAVAIHWQAVAFTSPQGRVLVAGQLLVCVLISFICDALRKSERRSAAMASKERRANEQLDELLDSMTDALIVVDRQQRVIRFNGAAATVWGKDRMTLGADVTECLPAPIAEAMLPPIQLALQDREPSHLEVFDSGSQAMLEIRIFPSNEAALVYSRDISESYARETELRTLASERERTSALLDSLLAHAPLGFAFFDRFHRLERLNDHFATMSGLPGEDHTGKTIDELLPDCADTVSPILDRVFAGTEAIQDVEIDRVGPNHTSHWLMGFYPVLDRDGGVKSVGAMAFDITQRKIDENRLRESELRFRTMADQAPVMIWKCGPDASAYWFNRPWLAHRNKDLEAALEEGCFAGIEPAEEERVKALFKEAVVGKQRFAIEYRAVDGHGKKHWLLAIGSPVLRENGEIENYIVSCTDVSDAKEAEQNVQRVLADERAARSEAERANRVKDEFVATLSHELRTPLTTILGWSELLGRTVPADGELRDGLEAIERSTRLQLQLINDLLDMSRISSGKVRLDLSYVDLRDIVGEAADSIKPAAAAKDVSITTSEPETPVVVKADAGRFTQIVLNVLSNGLKFTPAKGSIKIAVFREGDEAKIVVEDDGEGISPEFLPIIFDRFRQADGTVGRKHGGLGLGLAIVKQLVELHGGEIEARSDGIGSGAAFTISMPIADMGDNVHRHAGYKSSAPHSTALGGRRVLLVEDDESTRNLLVHILSGAGAIVIAAQSAEEARRLLEAERPDVVISDIGMPGEDGYSFIRSVRDSMDRRLNNIPAVALTAFASPEDRDLALRAGFQLHLTKPIESQDLIDSVGWLIKMHLPTQRYTASR